ncbi:3-oxoacyl-ACP reductase family protein [Leptospira sp. GIMC2001]|uniref:3-oxoacyl-ACP reductase family protein n=1 Tax=Leptospira sp. GIMC2001 TaxID=1513297 RepID=UPI002349E51D|nr:3-oxoacyl-ACP reductase family protein [Leptospira sp. GIMC2001]WCL50180.1 3-oxoacyl-ACP reductase FabG [Leptospira sp. GIMC2001]
MRNKIAIVTGGATGIGRACCKALSESGFIVGIHYNSSHTKAKALSDSLPGSFIIGADLSTGEGCDSVYDTIKAQPFPLEVLVNNAGWVKDNPIFSATLDEFDQMIAINMRATWYLTKRLSRLMIRNKQGRIINISSVVGSKGNATQSVYGMTKAGINNFSQVAALEFAQNGILVNSIAPGFIDTDMTKDLTVDIRDRILENIPLARMGKATEIAEVVQFLATSGNYITGTTIHVNGGMYAG